MRKISHTTFSRLIKKYGNVFDSVKKREKWVELDDKKFSRIIRCYVDSFKPLKRNTIHKSFWDKNKPNPNPYLEEFRQEYFRLVDEALSKNPKCTRCKLNGIKSKVKKRIDEFRSKPPIESDKDSLSVVFLVKEADFGSKHPEIVNQLKEKGHVVTVLPYFSKHEALLKFVEENKVDVVLRREEHSCLFANRKWKKMVEKLYQKGVLPLFYDCGYLGHYSSFVIDGYREDGTSFIYDEFSSLPEDVNWEKAPRLIQSYRNAFLDRLDRAKSLGPLDGLSQGYVVIWLQYSPSLLKKQFRDFCGKEKVTFANWTRKVCDILQANNLTPIVKCSPVGPFPRIDGVKIFSEKDRAREVNPEITVDKSGILNERLIAFADYHIVISSSVTNELILANAPVITMGRSWFNGLDIFKEAESWEDLLVKPEINLANRNKWLNWWIKRQAPKKEIVEKLEYQTKDSEVFIFNKLNNLCENKSVAIVGNAQSLVDSDCKEEIDKHDIVVRLNKGVTINENGIKTDIYCFGGHDSITKLNEFKVNEPKLWFWMSPKFRNHAPKNVLFFPMRSYNQTTTRFFAGTRYKPTTGLMTLVMFLKTKASQINLYGFDFWQTKTFSRQTNGCCPIHNKNLEKNAFTELMREDGRIKFHPCNSQRENLISQYAKLHKEKESYGRGFVHRNYLNEILQFCQDRNIQSVLDFGCGKGGLVCGLNNKKILTEGYDPAIPEFKEFPEGKIFDLVVSLDVFEHLLEETWLEELAKIKSVNPKFIYLNIATMKAAHHLPNGMNCHTLVKTEEWWTENLQKELRGYEKVFEKRIPSGPRSITLVFKKI